MTSPAKTPHRLSDDEIPATMSGVVPHLVCRGAAAALDFYARAFGAVELMRLPAPDGRLIHAAMSVNGATVLVVDEFREMGNQSPASLGATPVTLHMTVGDVDEAIGRAVDAGAKIVMPAADQFWGDRYGVIEDPYGHRWSIATPKRSLTVGQMNAAAQAMFAAAGARK